ncbi:hypothetical protein F511_03919 [Dorcoceras hygrometricum]|uniref:Uncharacterized protein n=1 Tax=Dorcoceras hygrometricum TaxID=472368 RepID=A0A2Z7D9K0_9LAMI|nr:hypothetical protein F511_03919 [Dorcoceras hygrometricum]
MRNISCGRPAALDRLTCGGHAASTRYGAHGSTIDARRSREGGGDSRPHRAQRLRLLYRDAAPSSSRHARPARMVVAHACAHGARKRRRMLRWRGRGITDSAFKNQLVVVSVQYGPFNPYIPIRSTTIGKSRVAIDPIAMHTSWRSNSDIASVTRVSMTFRVMWTNQYKQDLGLIHSTNGNHLESPNEGSSIDHQVTIYLNAQNITMFPTNETCSVLGRELMAGSWLNRGRTCGSSRRASSPLCAVHLRHVRHGVSQGWSSMASRTRGWSIRSGSGHGRPERGGRRERRAAGRVHVWVAARFRFCMCVDRFN